MELELTIPSTTVTATASTVDLEGAIVDAVSDQVEQQLRYEVDWDDYIETAFDGYDLEGAINDALDNIDLSDRIQSEVESAIENLDADDRSDGLERRIARLEATIDKLRLALRTPTFDGGPAVTI